MAGCGLARGELPRHIVSDGQAVFLKCGYHAVVTPEKRSKPLDEFVIRLVRTDPEPYHLIAVPPVESTVTDSDSGGIDRFCLVDTLEVKSRMERVLFPLRVCLFRLVLNPFRKKGE